jgi:aryl-alcohol dehydrogenase-like predicted oxidoreductase
VSPQTALAELPVTLTLGDGRTVGRLGFGAMRVTGPGIWGPPADESAAIALLQRVVDKGVAFIDTADSHGPGVSETLIAKALRPFRQGWWLRPRVGLRVPVATPTQIEAAPRFSSKCAIEEVPEMGSIARETHDAVSKSSRYTRETLHGNSISLENLNFVKILLTSHIWKGSIQSP